MGDATSSSLWTGITQNSWNPFVFLPADWAYLTQPDPSILSSPSINTLSNAAYGTLTADQVSALKQQTAAQITQAAGGNAALAAQQIAAANRNIDSLVSMNGGVAPSLATDFQSTILGTGVPLWVWLAGGGVLVLFLLRR